MRILTVGAQALLLLLASTLSARGADMPLIYDGLPGQVVLDNARVRVEKFELAPGSSTGRHNHPADQLLVFVKGGVLKSATSGRSTVWKDGRVLWQGANEPADAGSTNVGTAPIVMIWVTFKPAPPASSGAQAMEEDYHLNYPNIPGEDLFENEHIVVQRFVVMPGQWEGIHRHLPNMLYIHIKGGHWSERTYTKAERASDPVPDGAVGWMRTVPITEGHESHNVGSAPIDLVWVTLKD